MYISGLPSHCHHAGKKLYKIWEDIYCETQKNGNVTETQTQGSSGENVPSVSEADLSNQSNQVLPCLK